jgi:hypothetical protein
MELTHQYYRVTNNFGSGTVSGEEARKVWESWAPEQRGGNPEYGFVVWDVYEGTNRPLMSTSYLPLPDETAT